MENRCRVCDKTIPVSAVYCSHVCRDAGRRNGTYLNCVCCGDKFYVQANRKNAKFCSLKCLYSGRTRSKINAVSLECKQCGSTYYVHANRLNKSKFCSNKCAITFNRPGFEVKRLEILRIKHGHLNPKSNSKKERDARHYLDKKIATPPWADKKAIKAVYDEAKRLTIETGTLYHVDHIIPIHGRYVSGLHVPDNLRAIPAIENVLKHNFVRS